MCTLREFLVGGFQKCPNARPNPYREWASFVSCTVGPLVTFSTLMPIERKTEGGCEHESRGSRGRLGGSHLSLCSGHGPLLPNSIESDALVRSAGAVRIAIDKFGIAHAL